MCATFVVYVRSIQSLDIDLGLSLLCSSRRNGVFHTLDLEKAFSFRGFAP